MKKFGFATALVIFLLGVSLNFLNSSQSDGQSKSILDRLETLEELHQPPIVWSGGPISQGKTTREKTWIRYKAGQPSFHTSQKYLKRNNYDFKVLKKGYYRINLHFETNVNGQHQVVLLKERKQKVYLLYASSTHPRGHFISGHMNVIRPFQKGDEFFIKMRRVGGDENHTIYGSNTQNIDRDLNIAGKSSNDLQIEYVGPLK